jgi:hypothetical protein
MSSESPVSVLFSSDGYELAVIPSTAIPANNRGILYTGTDGTNAHFILVDSSGREIVVGAAATGAAPAGNPLYVGGLVNTSALSGLTNNTTQPLSLTTTGLLRVDGSNVTQPVSGTVTVNAGTGNFNNGSVSNTGAAGPAQATYMGAAVTTAAPAYTTGQMDPLSLTTAGLLRIDGVYPVNATTPTSDIAFVGGAVTTAAPAYTTGQLSALSLDTVGNLRTLGSGYVTTAAPAYTNNTPNYLSLTTVGNLRVDGSSVTQPVTGTGTAGTPATGVVTIQGITGGTAIPVSGTLTIDKSSTGTLTSVAAATSSTTLLASNANRISATVWNDSTAKLYLSLNATSSVTAYTIQLFPGSYWELPIAYTGAISGIWAAANGNARVTELT